jgi:hypothetical protein
MNSEHLHSNLELSLYHLHGCTSTGNSKLQHTISDFAKTGLSEIRSLAGSR